MIILGLVSRIEEVLDFSLPLPCMPDDLHVRSSGVPDVP
jgi:hypothetical protein